MASAILTHPHAYVLSNSANLQASREAVLKKIPSGRAQQHSGPRAKRLAGIHNAATHLKGSRPL